MADVVDLAVVLGADERPPPCIPLLGRRLVAGGLGGVVSSRAGRSVVVFVRLLLMLRIAQWEEMKKLR